MTNKEKKAAKLAKVQAKAAKAQAKADKLQRQASKQKNLESTIMFLSMLGIVAIAVAAVFVGLDDQE